MITIEELTEQFGLDHLSKAAEAHNITLKDAYEDDDPELLQLTDYKPQKAPSPQPKTGKEAPITRTQRQSQVKGALTNANQNLGKAAITSTQKQFEQTADVATREGVIAYGNRMAANLNTVAGEILSYGDRASEIIEAVEAEFALGGDDAPLALPASEFSLL